MFISGRKQTSLLPGNEGVELAEEVRAKKKCSCPLCTGSCTVTCCIFQPQTSLPGTCWCIVSDFFFIPCIAFVFFFFFFSPSPTEIVPIVFQNACAMYACSWPCSLSFFVSHQSSMPQHFRVTEPSDPEVQNHPPFLLIQPSFIVVVEENCRCLGRCVWPSIMYNPGWVLSSGQRRRTRTVLLDRVII